jgi:hypothetical protein
LQEVPGYTSSSFLSSNLWAASEGVDESDVSDGDDPEVDAGKASGNRQTNKKQETEEEKRKKSLQRTPQGIFTRSPIFNILFLNAFTVMSRFMQRDMARYKDHLSQMQENEGLAAPSRDKFPSYPLLSLLRVRL